MKKITLLCLMTLSFVFTSEVIAQTLNQNAGWPNTAWSVTGTYSIAPIAGDDSLEADPTVDANFAFDDDDAGNDSIDDIAAESPVIDLTAASGAGETLITIAGNYVYNRVDIVGELLTFQYWDADAANWENYPGGLFDDASQTVSQPTDDMCLGTPEPYTTDALDISGFTATQLSGFRYRIFYDDDFDGGNAWEYGFCFDAPTITSVAPLMCTQAVVIEVLVVNDCGNGQFQIDVAVDSVGDGTFINDGTNTFDLIAGSNVVGPYASGTSVTLTIEHSDPACDFTLADETFTCPTIPTVDGVLTINGCLDSDSFTTAFDGLVKSIYWIQLDYDGGCFELTTDTDGTDFDTELGLYDINGVLVANNDDDIGGITPQSLFTEEALPAGTYYLAAGEFNMTFGADNFNVTFNGTPNDTGTLVVNASTPSDNTVDFCNLQFPFEGDIETGEDHVVYTQVFEAGVTEPQGAQGAGIQAWIGFSETDATTTADFTSGDWTWVAADYNTAGPTNDNDEYFAEIGSARTEGTYYYVSRYSIDGGPFTYGGINPGSDDGNFWDGTNYVSGELTVTNPPPPVNDLCENATSIACGDVLTSQTTIQATGGSAASCNGSIGDDVWYQISGNDAQITITVDASIQQAQIGVFESTDGTCAGFTLGDCIDSVAGAGENPTSVSFFANAGTEYFIQVGHWINGNPGLVFEISATCTTCPEPSNLDADNLTEASAELSWTEEGVASQWNIEYGAPGFTLGVDGALISSTSDNPYTLNGLSSETDYEYYVQAVCGGDTSSWTGPFTFTTLPPAPANDACVNAIEVFDGDVILGSTAAATNVEGLTSCAGGTGGTNCTDAGSGIIDFGPGVWYLYTAGPDEDISANTEGSAFDTEIQIFTGDCNNLVCVGGDDDAGDGNTSKICWASSATTGTTVDYYIYVDGHATNNGDYTLNINVENTLSVDQYVNQNTFTYFPNPVKNTLSLKALQTIQSVSVLNILGQEVLRTTPNTLESNLDMNSLNTGSYFVKVTINDVTEIVRVIKN